MKIFFYGGSFDPPHNGHLEVIKYCSSRCDKMLIIPANFSPLKKHLPYSEFSHRKNMLKIMLKNCSENIEISKYDSSKTSPNYTYLTLRKIKYDYPNSTFTMILGADQFSELYKWKNINEILSNISLLIFNRNNINVNKVKIRMIDKYIKNFVMDCSSRKIRSLIKNTETNIKCLDSNVYNYILTKKLYNVK
tara:strand:+ start:1577 stop:2152 length:576 start_codon:yes stop_codon:yes gene_type:complete